MTGKALDGNTIGYANVGTVCNTSHSYGLSRSRYSTNFRNRTALTAASSRASHVREEMASLSGEVERLRSFLQQSELNLGDLTQRIAVGRSQVAGSLGQHPDHLVGIGRPHPGTLRTGQFQPAAAASSTWPWPSPTIRPS